MGRCKEWVKVVGDSEVDVRVLAMRHKDKGYIPLERQALKPERVLAYRLLFLSAAVQGLYKSFHDGVIQCLMYDKHSMVANDSHSMVTDDS